MGKKSNSSQELCFLEEIEESAAFSVKLHGKPCSILIVRNGRKVFGYVNSCPHIGAPLDMKPGKFLSLDKKNILCSNHGALFEIETGSCIFGPCYKSNLIPVELTIRNEMVVISGD